MWNTRELKHYGVKGQKWGVRNYQNYDGTYTPAGKERYRKLRKTENVFVSGSSKTQDPSSPYYRKALPKQISDQLDAEIAKGNRILVGDAPGIDRQVQDYLNSKQYDNVRVYGPGKKAVRYIANSKWGTKLVDAPDFEPMSSEWLAAKDVVMTNDADRGLAVILDEGAKATRKNVTRLLQSGKAAEVFQLEASGSEFDNWVDKGRVYEDFLEQL